MKNRIVWIGGLVVINTCFAFAVVYSKHKARTYHSEISQLRAMTDDLDVEWGQLQLEEGALSEYGRIERIARGQLGMEIPAAEEIQLILE